MSASDTQTREFDDTIRQGLEASTQGQREAALQLFRRAAELVPRSGIPHFLIGAELMQAGHVGDAEGAYANAVLLAPDFDMARYQLGLLQYTSCRAAVALVTWQPLFSRPPEAPLQRVVHGFAALAQDDFATATRCFEEGIALNRDNDALNHDLQMLLSRIKDVQQGKHEPRTDAATAVAGHTIDSDSAHVLLANYRQQGPGH